MLSYGFSVGVIVKFQMAIVNPTALASDNEVIDMLIDAVRLLVIKENVEPWPLPDQKTSAGKALGPLSVKWLINLTDQSNSLTI